MGKFDYRERCVYSILFFTGFIILMVVFYIINLNMKIDGIQKNWKKFNIELSEFNHRLNKVKESFGYGGFIHHFKNLVLRNDEKYIPLAEQSINATLLELSKLKKLPSPIDSSHAISNIENTVLEYKEKFLKAKNIFNKLSSKEIDSIVKVDDSKAFSAFRFLTETSFKESSLQLVSTDRLIDKTHNYISISFAIIPILVLIAILNLVFLVRLDHAYKYLLSLFNSIPDALINVDKSGNITECNKQMEILSGFSNSEILGAEIEKFIPVELRKSHVHYRDAYMDHPEKRAMGKVPNMVLQTKDGQTVPVDIALNHAQVDGKLIIIATIRDISHLKEMERKLQLAKNKSEKANKVKNNFIAIMGHEFKTPINAIYGMAELLENTEITTEQKEYIGHIKTSIMKLFYKIEEVLTIISCENDQIYIFNEPLNIFDLIQTLKDDYKDLAQRKKLQLDFKIDKNIPSIITGDYKRLLQVLDALIDNSIKFTHEGSINVDISLVENCEEKFYLNFIVQDTGIGIKENIIKEIFTSFYQEHQEYNRMYEGLGIGLTIARCIVRQMNGEISVNSIEGKGSEFQILIPFPKKAS